MNKEFLQKLVTHFKLTRSQFLSITKNIEDIQLMDVTKIINIDAITNRIHSAIVNKERIMIYGDYDCDGICATSIMKKTFDILGYHVDYFIPCRYVDGYGLNPDNVRKIAEKGYKLIICVDNGVAANEAIDVANENDIDVIVVDHHEIPAELPKAYGFIHPEISKLNEKNIYGSGAYMSLFLSAALLKEYKPYLVTLAGVSIVSDMMVIDDYNRDVLRLSLYYLNKYKYLPFKLLSQTEHYDEKTYGFDISPKINAVGRVLEEPGQCALVVKFLTTDDVDEMLQLAEWILGVNETKKQVISNFSNTISISDDGDNAIVAVVDTIEGIAGLIANNLLNKYLKPAFVLAPTSDPGILKGSCRSKDGFSIVEAFNEPEIKKFLLSGGGHAQAGGISIKADDFDEFKKEMNKYAAEHKIIPSVKNILEIGLQDVNRENYDAYRYLAPYGVGFEDPEFMIKHIKTSELSFISGGKHISTRLGMSSKLMGWNMPSAEVNQYKFIDVKGVFEINYFKGIETVQFRITEYKESK